MYIDLPSRDETENSVISKLPAAEIVQDANAKQVLKAEGLIDFKSVPQLKNRDLIPASIEIDEGYLTGLIGLINESNPLTLLAKARNLGSPIVARLHKQRIFSYNIIRFLWHPKKGLLALLGGRGKEEEFDKAAEILQEHLSLGNIDYIHFSKTFLEKIETYMTAKGIKPISTQVPDENKQVTIDQDEGLNDNGQTGTLVKNIPEIWIKLKYAIQNIRFNLARKRLKNDTIIRLILTIVETPD